MSTDRRPCSSCGGRGYTDVGPDNEWSKPCQRCGRSGIEPPFISRRARRIAIAVLLGVALIVIGWSLVAYAHVAYINCGADHQVHAGASQYNDGVYTLNGGISIPFHGGFNVTLDGSKAWTLDVTATDWAPFHDTAGPCRTTTTTEGTPSTSSSAPSTSTTITSTSLPPTAPTTSTAPPDSSSSSTSSTTSTSRDSSTTTSPVSSSSQPGTTCDGLTEEQCNATETSTTAAPSAAPPSPSPSTSPGSTPSTSASTDLPRTGGNTTGTTVAAAIILLAGIGAVVVARRRAS